MAKLEFLLLFLFLSGLHGNEKYSTLVSDPSDSVAVDTKTLESIVTDIDGHYEQLVGGFNGSDGGSLGYDSFNLDGFNSDGFNLDGLQGPNDLDYGNFFEPLKTYENAVSFEASGLKLAIALVSIWYILLVLLTGNLFTNSCPTIAPHELNSPPNIIAADGVSETMEMPEEFMQLVNSMLTSSNDESMEIPQIVEDVGSVCPQSAFFYGQNRGYMSAAMNIKNMLMSQPNPTEMIAMATAIKPAMNPKLWYTATMHAAMGMGISTGVMPCALDAMPDNFIPNIVEKSRSHGKDECIKLNGNIGKDNGIENKLWYFREDVGVNAFHWYWHLSWPLMTRNTGKFKTLMDRRGELFYYAHRSFVARYNTERLCHKLPPAPRLDPSAPIEPPYNPHLTDATAGQDWTPRGSIRFIMDINHGDNPMDRQVIRIGDWLARKRRLYEAVGSGRFVTPTGKKSIPPKSGIDMLGNTVEAVDISVNPNYYGRDGYHNDGHRILGSIEDPDFEKMLPPGVMGDPATAMRDPIFYSFHTDVNDIFEKYKATLGPYEPASLHFPGLKITQIRVIPRSKESPVNELRTFFSHRNFNVHVGLAFNKTEDSEEHEGGVDVCAKQLDHEEFDYEFDVFKAPCAKSGSVTFRVFLAPKFGLDGERMSVEEQRKYFVHLDIFNVKVPPGPSTIRRSSLASALTIPPQRTLSQLNSPAPQSRPNCGCGWPHNLLLPRGSKKGKDFDLFVMATNGDDYVAPKSNQCAKAWIYCGVANEMYPDSRPMGFPFDKPIYGKANCGHDIESVWYKVCRAFSKKWEVRFLEEFVQGIGNMAFETVTIRHVKKED